MQRVQLDMSRLFGFKIVAAELARSEGELQLGAKLGQKQGDKIPVNRTPAVISSKIGNKVGDKIGAKVGVKIP